MSGTVGFTQHPSTLKFSPGRSIWTHFVFCHTPREMMENMKATYDERKFTELILFVAERLRKDFSGGATKLNKVLFFAEFIQLVASGETIPYEAALVGAQQTVTPTSRRLEHATAQRLGLLAS